MKRNVESNLGYIMRILNISGKELAWAIHVDVSLVSKWKTRKRKIIPDSEYFVLLVDYVYKRSEETQHSILRKALSKFDYVLETSEEIKTAIGDFVLKENLKMLNNPLNIVLPSDPMKEVYDYNFRVFKGNAGRRNAVIQFFEKILTYDEPGEIWLFSQEEMSWMLEEEDYTQKWLRMLVTLLEKGHRIKMIHFVDRHISKISQVVSYWAHLYTHPNIESYYYARYLDAEFQISIFIEGERLAVYGNHIASAEPSQRYTAYYEDDYTVKMYRGVFKEFLSHSRPLVINYEPDHYCEIIRSLVDEPGEGMISFLSPIPHTAMMSEEHLVELLERHNVDEMTIERQLEYHAYFRKRMQAGLRAIISYDALKKGLAHGGYLHHSLSRCIGKNIILNEEDMQQLFRDLVEMSKRDHCEIVLIENGQELFNTKMNILVDHGHMVMSYNPEQMTHISVAEESTIVRSFEHYFTNIWNTIPRVKRTVEDLENQISRLMADQG